MAKLGKSVDHQKRPSRTEFGSCSQVAEVWLKRTSNIRGEFDISLTFIPRCLSKSSLQMLIFRISLQHLIISSAFIFSNISTFVFLSFETFYSSNVCCFLNSKKEIRMKNCISFSKIVYFTFVSQKSCRRITSFCSNWLHHPPKWEASADTDLYR